MGWHAHDDIAALRQVPSHELLVLFTAGLVFVTLGHTQPQRPADVATRQLTMQARRRMQRTLRIAEPTPAPHLAHSRLDYQLLLATALAMVMTPHGTDAGAVLNAHQPPPRRSKLRLANSFCSATVFPGENLRQYHQRRNRHHPYLTTRTRPHGLATQPRELAHHTHSTPVPHTRRAWPTPFSADTTTERPSQPQRCRQPASPHREPQLRPRNRSRHRQSSTANGYECPRPGCPKEFRHRSRSHPTECDMATCEALVASHSVT